MSLLNTLLFEIGTEEIPASFIEPAIDKLKKDTKKALEENRIEYANIECFASPRRIALLVHGIAGLQSTLKEKVKGPSKALAFDDEDMPSKALHGFLKGNNCQIEDIFIEEFKGTPYVFANKTQEGGETKKVLEKILPELLFSINFPKSMRWNNYNMRFARPVRWIVAMLNQEIIEFQVENIKSSNKSKGHRTLSNKDIVIDSAKTYMVTLREHFVFVSQNKRRDVILEQIKEIEEVINADVLVDEELLNEVVYLVEYPTAFFGEFDKEFLSLPSEAIIVPMKEHQRYFPVKKDGELLPFFVAVRNGDDFYIDTVKKGNERVLEARLKDAQFFYNEDLKLKLEDRVEDLKTIVYQAKLGTVYEKVCRIRIIGDVIADFLNLTQKDHEDLKRAVELCKADLVTGMVNEFDELQGVMGKEYALKNGEEAKVANAIYSHYLPKFAGDEIPEDVLGLIISIADKLDSVVGSFAIGVKPTGSQDPFGLRRQAIGVINMMIEKNLCLNLSNLLSVCIDALEGKLEVEKKVLENELNEFFSQRLKVILNDEGFRYDLVDSVLEQKLEQIVSIKQRLEVLDKNSKLEEFEKLTNALTRVYALSKKSDTINIDDNLFENEYERTLLKEFDKVNANVEEYFKNSNYQEVINEFNKLVEPIHNFFENVMVMVDDEKIKNNRLSLLKSIEIMTRKFCDYDKIVG